jgi:hypothetical protein
MSGNELNFIEKLAYKIVRFTDIDNNTLRRAVRNFSLSVPPGSSGRGWLLLCQDILTGMPKRTYE